MFSKNKTIRFAHCDPAGIVFYPRYAELANEVVEDWFHQSLGVNFHQLHEKLHLGIPAVRLEVEYLRPSTYGETLLFTLSVKSIGQSSMWLEILAHCHHEIRVRIRLKVVLMNMNTMKSVRIDDDWRDKFTRFLMSSDEAEAGRS